MHQEVWKFYKKYPSDIESYKYIRLITEFEENAKPPISNNGDLQKRLLHRINVNLNFLVHLGMNYIFSDATTSWNSKCWNGVIVRYPARCTTSNNTSIPAENLQHC